MAIQVMVRLEAVCDHPSGDVLGAAAVIAELETARFVSDLESKPSDIGKLGAGDAVDEREDLRGELFIGEASGGGNSVGC